MVAISDLRDRPDCADAVADRVWRALWKDDGHPLDLLTGLVRANLGAASLNRLRRAEPSAIHPLGRRRPGGAGASPAGIGAALVDRAAEAAFRAGAGRVYMLARAQRPPFYGKLGWSVLGVDRRATLPHAESAWDPASTPHPAAEMTLQMIWKSL